MTEPHHTADLIVVGGGMAGLIAAVRASELGLSVAVLEQGVTDQYPCNARWAGGIFHVAYNDVKRPESELAAAALKNTAGAADPALVEVIARDGRILVDWLARQGATFMPGGAEWQNWLLAPRRSLVAGLDWVGRGPDLLLRRLGETLSERGSILFLGTRATALRMQDGHCTGVTALRDGAEIMFAGTAILLADGGFQSDLDLLREHIASAPEKLKQRGAQTGLGAGLRMARAVGAGVTALDRFYGHLLSRDAMHNDRVWPYPELDALASAGILVGADGRRIANEGLGGIYLANAIARLADPLTTAIVFDANIWEGPGRSARIPANPQVALAGGTIHEGPDIASVAAAAGLPPATLAETVASYNEAVHGNTLDQLTPVRTTTKYPAMPISSPPYHVIPVCAGITYTMGGLRTDADARVLDTGGDPIPGLYAAGSNTGGLEGGDVAGYVGGLAKAGVFGLRAAEHIARQRPH